MGFGKIIGITVVGLGIIGVVGVMVVKSPIGKQFTEGRNQKDDSLAVIMEPVTLGDLERTVSAPGSIEPKKLINISSQVSAKVLALPFEEGEFVKEGDVVIRLDPQNLIAILNSSKAGLKQQQASLLGAEASLINARVQFERLQSLQETGDATKAELDSAEAAYLNAQSSKAFIEASIEQADARIEQAEKDLENTIISSPIDGVITALNTEVGETVIVGTTNNPGSIIMEIADLSEMLLKAAVDEANISPVRVGQEAKIFVNAYTEREYQGNIQRIGLKRQVAGDGTGTFEVEILMNLSEGETLYSGLSASTDIIVEHFYDAMIVPSQAVVDRRIEELPQDIREGNDLIDLNKTFTRIVYVVKDGKTVATPVKVGPSDLTQTVITEGLSKDDVLVTGPFRLLVDLKHDRAVRDQSVEENKKTEDNSDTESADDSESDAEDSATTTDTVDDDESNEDEQESP